MRRRCVTTKSKQRVGSGFFGLTVAERAANLLGKRVLVLD
ncbi:NAD(P)-binding protein, partial [Nocardia sp. NPDC050717]